ncbi:hypothetical protein [Cohnella lupini]|uniref:Uncharacterized protein n=1 Tax=Cohnella lupini TaxID=1294267 RepID=A0A3D9IWH6_9BACL|nr:hypothetical protein [Cohnella lupini]RED66055.1 hypothetical protein DFP95_101553 [Cohnella lupini]
MSFKPIDVQVSIPRSMELSPMQQQQQQRSATEQSLLGQQVLKTAEHDAKRSTKMESTTNDTISERQPRGKNKQSFSSNKEAHEETPEHSKTPEHPFKGKHIDFTG